MYSKIISIFIVWRVSLFIIAFLAVIFIPNFGAQFPYYQGELISTGLPSWIWGFGNFDGVHYLRIVKEGYASAYSQAFFPLYPILIKAFSFGESVSFITGLLISNISFLLSLIVLYKLFRLDFTDRISWKSILLLVTFPTSFYFGAVYTESLFLLFTILSIYFTRKNDFLFAGLFAALASATRVIGIFLWPLILIEFILYLKTRSVKRFDTFKAVIGMLIAPLGLIFYMMNLKIINDNPLYFLTATSNFGTGRSEQIVLLPQVLFRYLKLFISIPILTPQFFIAVLEVLAIILPLVLIIIYWRKIRFSYLVFTLGVLLLPTLNGTFNSMPRYSLMAFLLLPLVASFKSKYFILILLIFIILQIILVSFFTRGYWVS